MGREGRQQQEKERIGAEGHYCCIPASAVPINSNLEITIYTYIFLKPFDFWPLLFLTVCFVSARELVMCSRAVYI
jgi:hypothetical protein